MILIKIKKRDFIQMKKRASRGSLREVHRGKLAVLPKSKKKYILRIQLMIFQFSDFLVRQTPT